MSQVFVFIKEGGQNWERAVCEPGVKFGSPKAQCCNMCAICWCAIHEAIGTDLSVSSFFFFFGPYNKRLILWWKWQFLAIFVALYASDDCSKLRKNTFQCVSAVCKVTTFGFQHRKWVTQRSIKNFTPRAFTKFIKRDF